MWCNQIFSMIKEETVQNIIVCDNFDVANQLSKSLYGDTAFALDTTQYPLNIGDKCINGTFYKPDGTTLVERIPTEAEQIAILKAEKEALTERLSLAEQMINEIVLM